MRHHRHNVAGFECFGSGLERLVATGAAFDPNAAHRACDLPDDRSVEDFLFPEEANGATGLGDDQHHCCNIKIAAMVTAHNRWAGSGDVLDATEVEPSVRKHQRVGQSQGQLLNLDANIGNARNSRRAGSARRDIEMDHRPAARCRHQHHSGIRVHYKRMADSSQQRCVVKAVAISKAVGHVDAVIVGPALHCGQLARAPHKRSRKGAVVQTIGAGGVLRGHDIVEPKKIGKRLHEIVGRGGCQHDGSTGRAVFGEQHPRIRLHHVGKLLGDGLRRSLHGSA